MPLLTAVGNRNFRNTIRRIVTVSVDKTTVNEGDTITWTLTTQNVAAGSGFFYRLAGTGGFNSPTGFNQDDLLEGLILGTATVNSSGIGTVTVRLANDLTYGEGNEFVRLELREFADINSNILAASPYTTINDTSRLERGEFANSGIGIVGNGNLIDWYVPAGVFSISVLCIGGGGTGSSGVTLRVNNQLRYHSGAGGGGGGLAYVNNIAVFPGQRWQYQVGGSRGNTFFYDPSRVTFVCQGSAGSSATQATVNGAASGGSGGGSIATSSYARSGFGGGGGGAGGGGWYTTDTWIYDGGGGGGAAGYTGNGGRGSVGGGGTNWTVGSGGGGAGGFRMQGGGGVGALGIFSSGNDSGRGGSGGSNGAIGSGRTGGRGGDWGGGGGGGAGGTGGTGSGALGGVGYIRIVWPGDRRTFPSLSNS